MHRILRPISSCAHRNLSALCFQASRRRLVADTRAGGMGSLRPPDASRMEWSLSFASFASPCVMLRCVGGLEDVDETSHRACVFSDVCYDIGSSDFVFYTEAGNVSSPVIYDHRRGEQRVFRHRRAEGAAADFDFVALSKAVPYRQQHSWSPRTQIGPLPTRRATLPGLHALSAPFVPTNLGHVAWDEAFPLLAAMSQLGVYSPMLRIVRTHGCDALRGASSRRVCAKFESAFLAPLLGEQGAPVLTLAQLATSHARHGPLLCFERLLVGGAFDAFNSEELNNGREGLIALYRARVLAWHGVPHALPPRRHRILLVQKDGRRSIANFGAVRDHMAARFGSLARVRVTAFAGLTMAQQLGLVADTTIGALDSTLHCASREWTQPSSTDPHTQTGCPPVGSVPPAPLPKNSVPRAPPRAPPRAAISPCGGISMILPFLPEGAHAILMNYMVGPRDATRHGECEGCSWSMEAELWRHVRHVHKQYYQVWSARDFARGRPGRDASVKVDLKRMERLVAAALHDMQPF